jgi:hypothetical protein
MKVIAVPQVGAIIYPRVTLLHAAGNQIKVAGLVVVIF